MASPELDKAINMFRSAKEETKTLSDVEQFRAWYEGFTSEFPLAEDIVCERVGAGVSRPNGFTRRKLPTTGS